MRKSMRILILSLSLLVGLAGLAYGRISGGPVRQPVMAGSVLRDFTSPQLSEFDGTDPEKPVYLAFEGYVYDVSRGRSFYEPGGPYHELAGGDATELLHIAGGSIIRKKYPVIGILRESK